MSNLSELHAELIEEPTVGYEVRVLRLRQAFTEHAAYWRVVVTNNRTGEIVQRNYEASAYTAADAAADLLGLAIGEVK